MNGLLRIVALVLAVLLVVPGPLRARIVLQPTSLEKQAQDALDNGLYVKAREIAHRVLQQDPDNFVARWIMTQVLYRGDGDLPQALYGLRRLKLRLLQEYGNPPEDKEASDWYKQILWTEFNLLGEMDRRQEEIGVIDTYARLFEPGAEFFKIWPLMKLFHYQAAIKLALKFIDDKAHQVGAYNDLLSIYDEMGRREEAYEWGKRAILGPGAGSEVIAENLALASLHTLRYDEIERWVYRARDAKNQDTWGSPQEILVDLYLLEGSFSKSLLAFKSLISNGLSPRERVQLETTYRAMFASLLYALGRWRLALQRMRMVYEAPDRLGVISTSKWEADAWQTLLYWSVVDAAIEGLRELGSARSLVSSARYLWQETRLEYTRWQLQQKTVRLFTRPRVMQRLFRPYLTSLDVWNSWVLPRVLGPGVALKVVARVEQKDPPKFKGFYDALRLESWFFKGLYEKVVSISPNVFAELPRQPRLLRWTLRAITGISQWKLGDAADAGANLGKALRNFPSVLRHLHIALPAAIQGPASGVAAVIKALLKKSPRLDVTNPAPFVVLVNDRQGVLSVCLESNDGNSFGCVYSSALNAKVIRSGPRAVAVALVDRFHARLFSPRLDLTELDLNSLDGSPVRSGAYRILKTILGPAHKH